MVISGGGARTREIAFDDIVAVDDAFGGASLTLRSGERARVGDAVADYPVLIALLRQSMRGGAVQTAPDERAERDYRGGWGRAFPRAFLTGTALWVLSAMVRLGRDVRWFELPLLVLAAWAVQGFLAVTFTHVRLLETRLEYFAGSRWRSIPFDEILSVETVRLSGLVVYLRDGSRVPLGASFAAPLALAHALRARTTRTPLPPRPNERSSG